MPFAVAGEVIRHGEFLRRPLKDVGVRVAVFHERAFPCTPKDDVARISEIFARVAREEATF